MKSIAFLISSNVLDEGADNADVFREFRLEHSVLHAACKVENITLTQKAWDDPEFRPAEFDAVVIGPCWDYLQNAEAFFKFLEGCEAVTTLLNPVEIVRWNSKKTYLKELAELGAPTIPTLWADLADEATILSAFDELGTDKIVVKPVMGAGAWRQSLIRRGDSLPDPSELPEAECMIQPFLPAVITEGEFAFLFFDREFSHCSQKIPAQGDYRVQSDYGGRENIHTPSDEELMLARSVLDHVCGDLLYARVDMLRGLDGKLALIELELIEPYYFPEQGPNMGKSYVKALKRLMG